jgi:hypothetical protein
MQFETVRYKNKPVIYFNETPLLKDVTCSICLSEWVVPSNIKRCPNCNGVFVTNSETHSAKARA